MAYFEGHLRRATDEEGHDGYILEVEVDLSAVQNAGEMVGRQVAVTGDVEIISDSERGKILILRAASAAEMDEEEEDEE